MAATLKLVRQLAPVKDFAAANGWTIRRTGAGHLRYDKPDRQPVHSSSTPSCPYAHRKIIAEMSRQDKRAASQ